MFSWERSLSSVSLPSVSHLPLFIQVFICLLQPAYRLLYYSWAPYCFLVEAGCLFLFLYQLQPPWQGLIYNLTWLNFRITVGYYIYYSCLLQFPLILQVDYNHINVGAVANESGNKPEPSLLTTPASIFTFLFRFYLHYLPTEPDWLRCYSRLKPRWWLGNPSDSLAGPAGWSAASTLDLSPDSHPPGSTEGIVMPGPSKMGDSWVPCDYVGFLLIDGPR